jgi:hypothetical protein
MGLIMDTHTKTTQLITLLARDTLAGKVDWKLKDPPRGLIQGTANVVPIFIETDYKTNKIGVFQFRFKSFYEEDSYHWSENIGFCIYDNSGTILLEFHEYSPVLLNLFEIARDNAADINGLLDNLLK